MLRRREPRKTGAPETFIGPGVKAIGTLRSEGDMVIEGEVSGEVFVSGQLVIGRHGAVKGPIHATDIIVAGTITGDLEATHSLHILSTGAITGDTSCSLLTVDTGGVIAGSVKMVRTTEEFAATDDAVLRTEEEY